MSSGRTYGDIADPIAGAARRLRPALYRLDGWLYRHTDHARTLARLKDSHAGKPMLVVGDGPSLNHTPLDELRGIPAIGMNKIDLLFPRVRWRPTMVLCTNRHVLSQHAPRFAPLGISLYLSWQSRWFLRGTVLREAGFFLNLASDEFSTDITRGVGMSGTATYAALQFAYYTGADPVILVGMDHHFNAKGKLHALVRSDGADRDHFDPGYFDRNSPWNLLDLAASERGYRKARAAFMADGRSVLDATIGGKLCVFDKIDIADAVRIARDFRRPVLVYQMGKVGSRSLVAALEKLPSIEVLHVHSLNLDTLERIKEQHRVRGEPFPLHVTVAERINRDMVTQGWSLEMITLVREPISRNFAAFFENLPIFFDGCNLDETSIPIENYIAQFLDNYYHDIPLCWFNEQLLEPFGIDVFARPFPHHRGYDILECAGHRLLVLRCESPDDIKRSAVESFLGIHLDNLVRTNVGDEKHYGTIYQRFKERIRLPDTYVDHLLSSRYAQHFYTAEERARIRARWVRAHG